jgi:hypothetical protein
MAMQSHPIFCRFSSGHDNRASVLASEAQLSDNRFTLRGNCGAVNAAVDMATKKMAGLYLG